MLESDLVFNTQHDYHNGAHAHADDMLLIPISGHYLVAEEEQRGGSRTLFTGDIYLAPRKKNHSICALGPQEHLCYYLDADKIGDGLPAQGEIWKKSAYLSSLITARRQLIVSHRARKNYDAFAIDDLILREAYRIFNNVAPSVTWSEAALVEAVCDFVDANLAEDLSIGLIADHFRVAERTLARWFVQHKGLPLGKHILGARLARARDLVCCSDMPILHIQAVTGFESASHFSYAFRSAFGLAPSEMRRRPPG
jgi:AraC family transcriptional regulator